MPSVSCSLGFLSYYLCPPSQDGFGLHFSLADSFWAFLLWAPGVVDFLSGQKTEESFSSDPPTRKRVISCGRYPNTCPSCSSHPLCVLQTHGAYSFDALATIVELVAIVRIVFTCAVPRAASECL